MCMPNVIWNMFIKHVKWASQNHLNDMGYGLVLLNYYWQLNDTCLVLVNYCDPYRNCTPNNKKWIVFYFDDHDHQKYKQNEM